MAPKQAQSRFNMTANRMPMPQLSMWFLQRHWQQHLGCGPQCVDPQAGVQCWPGQCFRDVLQPGSTKCMIQVVMHLRDQQEGLVRPACFLPSCDGGCVAASS